MSISEFLDWIIEYWYIFFIIAILYIYSKYKDNEKMGNLSLNNMFFIVEMGCYFIAIYFIQTRLFNEHNYFLFSIPIFVLIWGFAINSILSKNDVYMVETALIGEEFNDIVNGKKVLSLSTRLRILIMDRTYYSEKKHIGEINNPLQYTSNRIKFTDYYDDNTGIFYHSEYPELQNINFFTRIATWLKLKADIPRLIRENIIHTWLEDYKIASQLKVISKDFYGQLKGFKDRTSKEPFTLFKTMDELLEYTKSIQIHDNPESSISDESDNSNNESENIEGE